MTGEKIDGRDMPYAVLVRGVLSSLSSLSDADPAVLFGDPIRLTAPEIRILDQCDLYSSMGEAYRELGRRNARQLGLSPEAFEVETKKLNGVEIGFSRHAAYRRNLRRWSAGQLPRKRRARIDFAMLAALWAAGWGRFEDPRAVGCRNLLSEVAVGGERPMSLVAKAGDVDEVLLSIRTAVEAVYRQSLDASTGSR